MTYLILFALGALLQLYVILMLVLADRFAEFGFIHASGRFAPATPPRSEPRRWARTIGTWSFRALVALITLALITLPYMLIQITAVRHAVPAPTWSWFIVAVSLGGLFVLLIWLMIMQGKHLALKIAHGSSRMPLIESLGRPTTATDLTDQRRAVALVGRQDFNVIVGIFGTAPSLFIYMSDQLVALPTGTESRNLAFIALFLGAVVVGGTTLALGQVQNPVGAALRRIEYLFGSDRNGKTRRFKTVLNYRGSLAHHLRRAATRLLRTNWTDNGSARGPRHAAMGLIAAAKVLEQYSVRDEMLATATPDRIEKVALCAAAVLVSPWDQAALTGLTDAADVFDEHGEPRPDLVEATIFRLRQRLQDASDQSGRIVALLAGFAALLSSVVGVVSLFR